MCLFTWFLWCLFVLGEWPVLGVLIYDLVLHVWRLLGTCFVFLNGLVGAIVLLIMLGCVAAFGCWCWWCAVGV